MNVQVVTMVMLIVLGALGLIIQGSIFLMMENDRSERVTEFNKRMKVYLTETVPRMRDTIVTVDTHNNLQMTLVPLKIPIDGSTDGIDEKEPTSQVFRATLVPLADIKTTAVTNNGSGIRSHQDFGRLDVALETVLGMECLKQIAKTACGSARCCTFDDFDDLCKQLAEELIGNFTAYPNINECRVSDVCGTCEFNGYIKERCDVLRWDATFGWETFQTNRTEGCTFPFLRTSHVMENTNPGTLTFTLRSLDDPYLWFANETKGLMTFGTTESEQRKAGLIMVGAGAAILLIGIVAVIAHHRNKAKYEKVVEERRKQREEEDAERAAKVQAQKMQELHEMEVSEAGETSAVAAAAGGGAAESSKKRGKKKGGHVDESSQPLLANVPQQPLQPAPPPRPHNENHNSNNTNYGNQPRAASPRFQQARRDQQQQQQQRWNDDAYGNNNNNNNNSGGSRGSSRGGTPRPQYIDHARRSSGGGGGDRDSYGRVRGGGGGGGAHVIDFGSANSTPTASPLGSPGHGRRYAARNPVGNAYGGGHGSTPHDYDLPMPSGRRGSGGSSGNFSGNSVDLDALPMPSRHPGGGGRGGGVGPRKVVTRRVVKTKNGAGGAYVDDEDL